MPSKSRITIGGVPIAATSAVAWRFVSGTQPYKATFSCHKSAWDKTLKGQIGKPLTLVVENTRNRQEIEQLYILHEVASDGPNRRSFVVADRRWKWPYTLVTADYNMTRKTGDRILLGAVATEAPIELGTVVDRYWYRPYSLAGETKKWVPKPFLLDVIHKVEEKGSVIIESFPSAADRDAGEQDVGGLSIQNVSLRDSGDAAIGRALAYVSGADLYVRADGKVAIFNALSKYHTDEALRESKPATWEGERLAHIDRKAIRPSKVNVHYQREVETLLEYSDDFSGGTSARVDRNRPYVENVMQTVDPVTLVLEYDPITEKRSAKSVPTGTYVEFGALLEAWDLMRPAGSRPWTFATISKHWMHGDLEGVLGAKGLDIDPDGNVSARVSMIRTHFRQTFRINQRVMERVRDLQNVRVFVIDPVSGVRAPSTVWGQACVVSSMKGKLMASRTNPEAAGIYRNVSYYPEENQQVKQRAPGPARVHILDRDLGIFRLEWITSPYGTIDSFVPCHLVGEGDPNKPKVPTRDLSRQDNQPMGVGARVEGTPTGIFLRSTMKFKAMVTMVPVAPNSNKQFHVQAVEAVDIEDQFEASWSLKDGDGPELNVYVPPGEATARFGWLDDEAAPRTMRVIFGLDQNIAIEDDPKTKDVDESKTLPGYEFINLKSEITDHARAVATEAIIVYADGVQGTVVTDFDPKATLRGRMDGVTIVASAAPSGKVQTVLSFPGQNRTVDRFSVLPQTTRALLLGIVPFGKSGL